MKKLLMGLFAVGLVLAMALPAFALDNEFGGFWRTRAYMQKDFTGSDTGVKDISQVDTRTRLFYTAVFSEDFKFVNRFEFNFTWGDTASASPTTTNGGGIASSTADRSVFRLKNSYANFNLGSFNFLVGLQPRVLHRGFLFDADFAGLTAAYNGDGFSIPFIWMKAYEGQYGNDSNDNDVDFYGLKPTFTAGNVALTPTLVYVYSKDGSKYLGVAQEIGVYFAGLDADVKFGDGSSAWFTGIYAGGSIDTNAAARAAALAATVPSVLPNSIDIGGYLLALGGTVKMGALDIHGQAFYATGDDTKTLDKYEGFFVPQGQMYYWSEIMGYGLFDNQASANAPADKINNIEAINIGVGLKANDKLSFKADLWYAKLVEDTAAAKSDPLGTEIDLKVTYALMKNLNLDVIGAYLFAGDGTYKGAGSSNPYEVGAMLSFSF